MDGIIYTLQDFFLHTKSITYLLMGPALFGFVGLIVTIPLHLIYASGRRREKRIKNIEKAGNL